MRAFISLLTIAVICSIAPVLAPSPASATAEPIHGELRLGDIRGLVYVEEADRIVVSGDDEVQIFRRDGVRTHRLTGIRGALGAEAVGTYVVVAAPATGQLVVIDTLAGTEVKRITAGAQRVSSIAASGDTVWYAHGPDQWDAGIGKASVSAGTATPGEFGIYANSIVAASPGLPDTVFGVQTSLSPSNLYRYDLGDPNTELRNPYHSSFAPLVISDSGDWVWSFNNGNLIELSAASLVKTGFFYEFPDNANFYDGRARRDQMIANHNDELLGVLYGNSVAVYEVGNPAIVNLIPFRSGLAGVDITERQIFVAESGVGENGNPKYTSRLTILDRNFQRGTQVVDVYVDAYGTPPDASRPTLSYSCGSSYGQVPVSYGHRVRIEIDWITEFCSYSLNNLNYGSFYSYGVFHDGTWYESRSDYQISITGDPARDAVSFVYEFSSPFNDPYSFVNQQFMDLLDRPATIAERNSRSDRLINGTPPERIVTELVESPEFLGSIAPLSRLYLAYFERQPDDGGLSYWLGTYRNGLSLRAISQYFSESQEFRNTYGSLDDREFVALVYENVLGRTADDAGLSYWLTQMAGGMSRGEVMINFSESVENIRNVQTEIIVRALYYGMLGREPDASGFEYWVGIYNSGGSLDVLVRSFLESREYGDRFYYYDDVPAQLTPDREPALAKLEMNASTFAG